MLTHTLGFPRIGLRRELKKAVESYWAGTLDEAGLRAVGRELRLRHWTLQREAGIDLVPVGDFSYYDIMLDTFAMLGAVPSRFGADAGDVDLPLYFRMARGGSAKTVGPAEAHGMGCSCGCSSNSGAERPQDAQAMEMTKWFDTNYHYIVPELAPGQAFSLRSRKLLDELREAKEAGFAAKAVLPGPVTFIALAKGENRWHHLGAVVAVYAELLRQASALCGWIQLDEPILVTDLSPEAKAAFLPAYQALAKAASPAKVLLTTYFGSLDDNLGLACSLPVGGLHLDLCHGEEQLAAVLDCFAGNDGRAGNGEKVLSLGLVDGHNIWRTDVKKALGQAKQAVDKLRQERVWLGGSCSFLHVPIDLAVETKLDPKIRGWMAYARQKCEELAVLKTGACGGDICAELTADAARRAQRAAHPRVTDATVRERMRTVTPQMACRKNPFPIRKPKQDAWLKLPILPTTTIGSFPQTKELRAARSRFNKGEISREQYEKELRDYIDDVVTRQEELGFDVLVHGEPERTDMVEYFGMQLSGFCFTENGWVQSYGSRCVKPPVIYGDVSRPQPMTVDWITYAASRTKKPMKGMLTGPVTILCWSFVRDDLPRAEVCGQIALAIRDEVADLATAGINVIQIDEAALREGLPLRRAAWDAYLGWAVESFRLATACVDDAVQIHTHMCYSEFNQIAAWIAKMDADVISIEASRSKMELLDAFREFEYPNDIGPGVYDIHSPRVPSVEEMAGLLRKALEVIPAERLWVNPDCGLKTRAWPETMASLQNLTAAARQVRVGLE